MEEASACGNVTVYGGKVSNSTFLFRTCYDIISMYTKTFKER